MAARFSTSEEQTADRLPASQVVHGVALSKTSERAIMAHTRPGMGSIR